MKTAPKAVIRDVQYALPDTDLSNESLKDLFPEWPVEKIARKTGVHHRRIVRPDEFTSDLAAAAAEKLFATGRVSKADIDFVILCTMTPDYQLPATACLLQTRLGLPSHCAAFDLNMGCTGYIYGLSLAKGLVETGQARNVLFITAETITKLVRADDKSSRTIFGDSAAATWINGTNGEQDFVGPFDYSTHGSAENMVAIGGGMRGMAKRVAGVPLSDDDMIFMNGREVYNFTLEVVPASIARCLEKAGLRADDIDLFVFHQSNGYMLESLRQKLGIPPDRFSVRMDFCGNTVSSSIPIALAEERAAGRLKDGMRLLLAGFGVGYSLGSVLVRWSDPTR